MDCHALKIVCRALATRTRAMFEPMAVLKLMVDYTQYSAAIAVKK